MIVGGIAAGLTRFVSDIIFCPDYICLERIEGAAEINSQSFVVIGGTGAVTLTSQGVDLDRLGLA